MINIIDSLKDKPTPLSKKQDIVPTSVPIAEAAGATPKQAQMAPSPQAQKAQAQKSQRSAQVESQEARAPSEESNTSFTQATNMISNLANLNAENLQKAYAAQEVDVNSDITPEGDVLAGQIAEGTITEESIQQQASQALENGLEGLGEFGVLTLAEVANNPDFADISKYAVDVLGLDSTATLNDIQSAVSTEIDNITQVVDTQNEILRDPNATPMERQEASRNMVDYGAAHLIASDQELAEFENDIKNVDVMEINGQTFTLEDIEDNDAVMALVVTAGREILNDPDHIPDWAEDNPALFDFVKKNANAVNSIYLGDDSLMSDFETVKGVVSDNKVLTDSMGEGLTTILGLNTPSSTSILKDSPGLEIFSVGFDPTELDLEASEVQDSIKYLSELDPDQVKAILSDPKYMERLPKLVARVEKLQSIDNAKSLTTLTSSLGTDYNQLKKLKTDIEAYPDKYDSNQKEFVDLFFTGNPKEALKKWYVDPDNVQPDISGQTYGDKVIDNYKNKALKKGIDLNNIQDFVNKSKHVDKWGPALQKVNSTLSELAEAIRTNSSPELQALYNRVKTARSDLLKINPGKKVDREAQKLKVRASNIVERLGRKTRSLSPDKIIAATGVDPDKVGDKEAHVQMLKDEGIYQE
jgi:hypothetical protein